MRLLYKIFGPTKREIWKQFCLKISADYESGGHWFKESTIRAKHRNWTMVLDTHQIPGGRFPTVCTRMRVLYINKDGFRFSLDRKNITSKLMTLGMSHTKVGPPQIVSIKPLFGIASYIDIKQIESNHVGFDEKFIINANDEGKLRALFRDLNIRELIQSQKSFSLEVSKFNQAGAHFSHNIYELCAYVTDIARDLGELETLYNTVICILDTLCHIDSADESPPHVHL